MRIRICVLASLLLVCHGLPMLGQQLGATATNLIVPPLVQFNGLLTDINGKPLTGVVGVTFCLYKDSEGGAPLWMETQNVQPNKAGHYSVMLGSTTNAGLPLDLFSSGEARWLGVQPQGQNEQPRVLLLSVPYALKAEDAETVGGLPPSAFMLAAPPVGATAATAPSAATTAGSGSSAPPAGTVTGSGTVNFLPIWTGTSTIGNSVLFQSGTGSTAKVGINTSTPASTLDVKGAGTIRGLLSLPATGTATATAGTNSQPLDLAASAFNSNTAKAQNETFQWQAEPSGNNTTSPSGTLNLLFGSGTSKPAETGLKISNTGIFTFASGQTFPGTGNGTITGVSAGTDLTGGGSGGSVTLNLDITKVPLLAGGNSFSGNQSVSGNVSATQLVSSAVQGTAPLQVTSTTQVPNLNASFLGGFPASAFQATGSYATLAANTFGGTQTVSNGNVSVSSGNLNLPSTASATVGVVNLGGTPFLHSCCAATSFNTFVGGAGNLVTTGSGNAAIGYSALSSITQGLYNTAAGNSALFNDTTGGSNSAFGSDAMTQMTTGSENSAIGFGALNDTTTGNYNTASGSGALLSNTTGSNNTAIGANSGDTTNGQTTGSNNTFVGYNSNPGTQLNLTNATAIGANAQVTANNSLVLGSINGVNGANASVNVGIGTTAPAYSLDVHGTGNFTGMINFASGQTFPGTGTITGVTAGAGLTGGGTSGSVTVGLVSNACSAGTALSALPFTCSPFATLGSNTFTGNQTVSGNLTATGVVTGNSFQIGSNLFGFGSYASANAFLGFAGNATTPGTGNTAVGLTALAAGATGYDNTAIGADSLFSDTGGTNNTGVGVYSLPANTTGNQNTAAGVGALYRTTTGSWNTALGFDAGLANVGGSLNLFLGYNAVPGTDLNNATAIGANAQVTANNAMVLGSINGVNGGTADTYIGIGTTAPSNPLTIVGNSTYIPLLAQSSSTFGTWMELNNTSAGGKNWAILSAGSTNAEGAGNLGITNFSGTSTIYLEGNVAVSGNLSKGSGSFKIDHPLDPANKFLYHSFVESPDMMNVYNGNVITNQHGLATVVLPDYFEALNRDFRYQLTVIGQFAQAIVAREISRNRFTIRTDKPSVKVSWQVTGIRHDAYADAHRIQVEEEKSPQEQGRYLHPELFGASPEQAIGLRLPLPAATADMASRSMSRLAPEKQKE